MANGIVTVTLEGGALCVKTPYNAGFVAAIKSLPLEKRKYEPARRVWLVAPSQASLLESLITQYYGVAVTMPAAAVKDEKQQRVFDVRYIGLTKERATGEEPTAFGFVDGQWRVIFPEGVLRAWFADAAKPTEVKTLYSVLSVARDATQDDIKKSYRRLARQWHPDVCKEPDAVEQFKTLQAAYDVLGDGLKRAKYEAGLQLEASLHKAPKIKVDSLAYWNSYRSPLRCGLILCDGIETLGRFKVEKIVAWEDITNARGQVLVSSWIMGDDKPLEVWS